jgi:hypothetical protein
MYTELNKNMYKNLTKTHDQKNNLLPIKCGCGDTYFYKNRFFHFQVEKHKEYMIYKRIHHSQDPYEDLEFID